MANLIYIPPNINPRDIELHLSGNKLVETVEVEQYDSKSVYIRATVYNNGELYRITESETVDFISTKPNGDGICNSCGRDFEGNIIYEITANTTAQSGWFDAQFKIYDSNGGVKSTPKFKMSVNRSALSNDAIIGAPEFNALDELITDATDAIKTVADINNNEQSRINNENTRIESEEERIVNEAKRPNWVKLTQAQYDALSIEEKMSNTFYEIMDDDGEVITDLEVLVDDLLQAKTAYDASVTAGSNTEVVNARKSNVTNTSYSLIGDRMNAFDSQLAQTVKKNELLNGLIAKEGVKTWAQLQAMTAGNTVGDFYYCSDGDGTNPAGNYRWTGSGWSFGGTGDEGYNILKSDLTQLERTNITDIVALTDFVQGTASISDGKYIVYSGNTNRIRQKELIDITSYNNIFLSVVNGFRAFIHFISADKSTVISGSGGWVIADTWFAIPENSHYLGIIISKVDDTELTISEKNNAICMAISNLFEYATNNTIKSKIVPLNNVGYITNSMIISTEILYDFEDEYISSDGNTVAISSALHSDYYPCKTGDTLTYALSGSANYSLVSTYDDSLNFVESKINGAGWSTLTSGTVTFGENDKYFRVCSVKNAIKQNTLKYNDIPTPIANSISQIATNVANGIGIEMVYENKIFAYLSNGANIEYTYSNNNCDLKLSGNLIISYKGNAYTFTISEILAKAEASSVVTVADGIISGAVFSLVFSKTNKTIDFVSNSVASSTKDYVIVFYHHYSSTNFGLLTRYAIERKVRILESSVVSNNNNITALTSRVDQMEAGVDYPAYVQTEVERVKAELLAKMTLGNIAIIGVNTDQHISSSTRNTVRYGLKAMSNLTKYIPFNMICLCGDSADYSADEPSEIIENILAINEPLHDAWCSVVSITGNHDANQNSVNVTNAQIFNAHFKRQVSNGRLACKDTISTNGVVDDDSVKIRFIFCDTTSRYDADGLVEYAALSACREWLESCLSTLPAGYKVVTFSHHALTNAYNGDVGANTGLWQGINCQDVLAPYAENIICCISGHWHKNSSVVDGNGITYIVVTSAMYTTSASTLPEINDYPRTLGAASETAFEIFCIDQDKRKIYAIRYGAGGAEANREWSY